METVLHQQGQIDKFGTQTDDIDYDKAVGYCTSILTNCPASILHACLKCEYLLRNNQLKECSKFTSELMQKADMAQNPRIISWRGRVMIYGGNENLGKQTVQNAIQMDPDLTEAKVAFKMVAKS
jgi:DnaJ homolog subfamily C member 7